MNPAGHALIGPSLPLGEQLAHLSIVAIVSAWIAWLWTHEEIFADCQAWLKDVVKVNRALMMSEFKPQMGKRRYWPSIVKHWAKQKTAFGLTCQTCFVHYPSGVFIWYNGYHLVERGFLGGFYAWMFVAFTGDSVLWLLGIMRKSKAMEDNATRALGAGAVLLERKVDKDETTDVPVPTVGGQRKDKDGAVVEYQHSGPTI